MSPERREQSAPGEPAVDLGSPPQASDDRDDFGYRLSSRATEIEVVRVRTYFSSGCFTRPPGTSARNHLHEPTTSKPVVPVEVLVLALKFRAGRGVDQRLRVAS